MISDNENTIREPFGEFLHLGFHRLVKFLVPFDASGDDKARVVDELSVELSLSGETSVLASERDIAYARRAVCREGDEYERP